MASTRDIKRRIRSIENTRQITRAMEMVAATKMRRAQAAVLAARPYADKAGEILAAVGRSPEHSRHPLLAKRTVRRRTVVLMTSDRGLCGTMNSNVVRAALTEGERATSFAAVGRKAETAVRRHGLELEAAFVGLGDSPSYLEVTAVATLIMEGFQAGRSDEVSVAYPHFVSTLRNEPRIHRLLPASVPETTEPEGPTAVTIFEPDEEAVLTELVPKLVEIQLWQAFLETKASEHSSRMMAMRNASDNAANLLDELRFSYNQARQAAITKEIAEIASGAEALA